MKSIKELVKRKEKLYFEVDHKDTKEFLRYLKHYTVKWSDGSIIDINDEFDSHRKILIGIEYKDKGYIATYIHKAKDMVKWCFNESKVYFDEIKEDKPYIYKNNTLYIKGPLIIPEYKTNFKKGRFNSIVLPVLEEPSDIKKLFNGFNSVGNMQRVIIYYEGNIEESKKIMGNLTTKDFVYDKEKYFYVCPSLKAVKESEEEIEPFNYWDINEETNAIQTHDYLDVMNKLIVPIDGYSDDIDEYFNIKIKYLLRCLDPRMQIKQGLSIFTPYYKTRKAIEIPIYNKQFKEKIIELLHRLHIYEIYEIKWLDYRYLYRSKLLIGHLLNEYGETIKKLEVFLDDAVPSRDRLLIDDKNASYVGNIMLMALGPIYNSNKELFEGIK